MKTLKKAFMPLLLVVVMLMMAVSVGAANSSAGSIPVSKESTTVKVSASAYDGSKNTAGITIKDENGKTINKKYYTVKYYQNGKEVTPKGVGKYDVKITFKSPYTGTLTTTYKINPGTQAVKVSAESVNVQKKAQTVKITGVKEGAKASYKKSSGSSKIKLKGNKINIAKGTKNAKAKIVVKTKKTKNYKATTNTITVTVKNYKVTIKIK